MTDTIDLQQFEALPIEGQIKRLINASDAEFSQLNRESGLKYRRYPYQDRIYEERCRRKFPKNLIKFREEMPWDRFYCRMSHLLIDLESKKKDNTKITMELCRSGRLMELKVLDAIYSILPDVNGANLLAEAGNLSILEFLETKGILPDKLGANGAAKNHFILVLDWLKERHIFPTFKEAIDLALEYGNIIFLDWCESQGQLPDKDSPAIAVENDQLEVLKWLVKKGIRLTTNDANIAANNGNLKILEYFEQLNILPNEEGIAFAKQNEDEDTLRWLQELKLCNN